MFGSKDVLVDPADLLMVKKGLGHQHIRAGFTVQLPGKPVGNVLPIPEKLGPLGRFQ